MAKDIASGININYLEGAGSIYERHRDTNPVTGILFGNSLTKVDGGELVFETVPEFRVRPRKGLFIIFDARDVIHYVSPLSAGVHRVSLPMNFYDSPIEQSRPADLNNYLYGR